MALRGCQPHPFRQRLCPLRAAAGDADGAALAGSFARNLLARESALLAPPTHPSPFLPPTRVVEAVLLALQRNDTPDEGAGLRTAFAFSLRRPPAPGQLPDRLKVLGWRPRRTRLVAPDEDFQVFAQRLSEPPYSLLLGAALYESAPPAFAVGSEECEITVRVAGDEGPSTVFLFRLACVLGDGPWKQCWMVKSVATPAWPLNRV